MSRRQCCVWGCSNRKGRCPKDVGGALVCGCSAVRFTDCPKSANILTLHNMARMPDDTKKATIARINLTRSAEKGKKWEPTGDCFICNLHYADFIGPSRKSPKRIPEYFARPSSSAPARKKRRVLQRTNQEEDPSSCDPAAEEEELQSQSVSDSEDMNIVDMPGCSTAPPPDPEARVRELALMNASLHKLNEHLQQEIKALLTQPQRLDVCVLNSSELHIYTGLNHTAFDILLKFLEPVVPSYGNNPEETQAMHQGVRTHMSTSQKLLMTLMRIRRSLLQEDLAVRFVVNQSTVSRTLNSWIPMLARQLEQLIQWPQTTIGPSHSSYIHLPNTVGIIDGTEIFIERPSNLTTQKATWSDYKSHNTAKYLVCIDSFTGVFTFVSPGFSGNASDRFTVEHSRFLDKLKPGQRILADRGYTARDLLARKQAFLTIPSFLGCTGKLSGEEAVQMRKIASVRIRVENAIKRLKDYKIFKNTQPNRVNKKILDDMVIIACALCNLQPSLIKSESV